MPRIPGIPDPHFNWGSELVPMNARGGGNLEAEADINSIDSTYVHYNDYYFSESSQRVIIRCSPKAVHVESVLSEPVNVDGDAHWTTFLNGFLGGGNIMTMLDFLGRSIGKGGLHQPWMSRKVWQGSEPLKLTLNLKFLTTSASADIEVYQPTCQLLSLVYPGGVSDDGKKITSFIPPGPSAFFASKDNAARSMSGQTRERDGATVGHPVEVQVGNFILFQSCLVTHCNINYSPTLDIKGYPTSAIVNLSIETFEEPYVNINATNKFSLFKPNQQNEDMAKKLADTLVAMAQVTEDTARWTLDVLGITSKSTLEDHCPDVFVLKQDPYFKAHSEEIERYSKNYKWSFFAKNLPPGSISPPPKEPLIMMRQYFSTDGYRVIWPDGSVTESYRSFIAAQNAVRGHPTFGWSP